MSAGEGPKSRIYKTTDGGTTWLLIAQFEPKASGLHASGIPHGIISAKVVEKFTILTTIDSMTWQPAGPSNKGEGAFAASGTWCSLVAPVELV